MLTSPHVRATGDCRMLSVFERLLTLLYSEPDILVSASFCVPAYAPLASKDVRKLKLQSISGGYSGQLCTGEIDEMSG